ncbi:MULTISPECIES: hypothetical protein [Aeromonas]|uniref:Uncharacterized protein n=1 Tax=Aeromonas caviae TaxID=648 RepID=A0AAJ5ZAR4_AERCA|nr:hypothetical protein [Aeromonas caviae]WFG00165.1 hypothetical protein P5S46_21970 [Aeromonas caviae]WVM47902.1 hypothetical protein V0242_25195 [Aeromonas hydrophila]
MNNEWEEGYQAFQDGAEPEHNPYADAGEFDQKFSDWQIGWECAAGDAE